MPQVSPTYVAVKALQKHKGDVDAATAETGLLRSFVADTARQFAAWLEPVAPRSSWNEGD